MILKHAARLAALALFALAFVAVPATPAMAACPYTGNSSDTPPLTDAAASLAALNEICAKTAAVPTGGATAANQTATQANAGSDASKANAVQGITGGKPVAVSGYDSGGTATTDTTAHANKMLLVDGNGTAVDPTNPAKVYQSFTYTNINTSTSTQIKSAAGTLLRIIIGKKGASSNIATLYDNTACSGTVISIIDTTDRVGAIEFGAAFGNGLCVKTETGTQADITAVTR